MALTNCQEQPQSDSLTFPSRIRCFTVKQDTSKGMMVLGFDSFTHLPVSKCNVVSFPPPVSLVFGFVTGSPGRRDVLAHHTSLLLQGVYSRAFSRLLEVKSCWGLEHLELENPTWLEINSLRRTPELI